MSGTLPCVLTHEDTREELVKHLKETSEGWWHLANDKLAQAAHEGAALLESGEASSVQVGHTTYTVTD